MSNMRVLWKNRWDDATLTVTSEDPDFPVTNTQHRWHTRTYRSEAGLSGSSIDIEADLGSDYDVQAIVIKNHNLVMTNSGDELRLQARASDADPWGAIDVVISVTPGLIILFFGSVKNYRYWRLRLIDSANADGYIEIGRIYLGPFFEFHYDIRTRSPVFRDLSTVKRSTGGQISSDQKPRYKEWAFGFSAVNADDFDSLWDIWLEVGKSKDYFLCDDADAVLAYKDTWYVQNLSDWSFDPREKGFYTFSLEVEELL